MRIHAFHLHHTPEVIALRSILLFLIVIFIILSNIINIHILRKSHDVQVFTRMLLINLSVAGLINGIFVCLPGFLASVMNNWPLGEIYCQISSVLNGSSCTVTIWCLAAISLDRYVAIHYPIFYRNSNKFRAALITTGVSWFLAVLFFLLPLIRKLDDYNYSPDLLICSLLRNSGIFFIVTGFFIYILSGIILFFSSFNVIMKLRKSSINQIDRKKCLEKNRNAKAMRLLIISSVSYFISWGPFTVADFLVSFNLIEKIPAHMDFVITWLANSNSFMNVLIYSGSSKQFLLRLKRLLQRYFRIEQSIAPENLFETTEITNTPHKVPT